MLAAGDSGAQIAEQLVLSPETVRTHIRNAMAKLGASSRAQAVALAFASGEIQGPQERDSAVPSAAAAAPKHRGTRRLAAVARPTRRSEATLTALLVELVALYDVDGGAIYLAEDGGLSLRRATALEDGAERDDGRPAPPPKRLALGESAPGRAALERRPQMIHAAGGADAGGRTMIAAPMASAGTLVGVICLTTRPSRLTGRGEMLLLQALANRVGEVLLGPQAEQTPRLKEALDRFRASWSAADHT
jgi:hypothetical protein